MTTQPNLKSVGITNADASPVVRNGAGQAGGPGRLMRVCDVVGPTTNGDTTGGQLRALRIPSNCFLIGIKAFQKAATTTATFTISLFYSDAASDGTSIGNTGEIGTSIFSSSNWDSHAVIAPAEVAFLNTSGYLPTDVVNPIWKSAATSLTSDPGGYFDIVFVNTATISGAATLVVYADYMMPE